MSNTDRTLRLIIAAIIAVLFFTGALQGVLAIVLLVLAGVFVLTSLAGSCPLYTLLGISTCRVASR